MQSDWLMKTQWKKWIELNTTSWCEKCFRNPRKIAHDSNTYHMMSVTNLWISFYICVSLVSYLCNFFFFCGTSYASKIPTYREHILSWQCLTHNKSYQKYNLTYIWSEYISTSFEHQLTKGDPDSFSDAAEAGAEHGGSPPGSLSAWRKLPHAAVDITSSIQGRTIFKLLYEDGSFDGHECPCCTLSISESILSAEPCLPPSESEGLVHL